MNVLPNLSLVPSSISKNNHERNKYVGSANVEERVEREEDEDITCEQHTSHVTFSR